MVSIVDALDILDDSLGFVPEADLATIRRIIKPHWDLIGKALVPRGNHDPVNSEQEIMSDFENAPFALSFSTV